MRFVLIALVTWLGACSGPADPPGPTDSGARDAGAVDSGVMEAGVTDAGPRIDAAGADAGAPGGLTAAPEPPAPSFPDVIDTLTISLRTGTAESAGTDDPVELCLTETDCFDPNTPEIDDRQVGLVDELHFSGIDLPRSAVDRVVLRSRSDPATDNDRWTPECLHLRFDGEPVYCNDTIGAHIGTGASA